MNVLLCLGLCDPANNLTRVDGLAKHFFANFTDDKVSGLASIKIQLAILIIHIAVLSNFQTDVKALSKSSSKNIWVTVDEVLSFQLFSPGLTEESSNHVRQVIPRGQHSNFFLSIIKVEDCLDVCSPQDKIMGTWSDYLFRGKIWLTIYNARVINWNSLFEIRVFKDIIVLDNRNPSFGG